MAAILSRPKKVMINRYDDDLALVLYICEADIQQDIVVTPEGYSWYNHWVYRA